MDPEKEIKKLLHEFLLREDNILFSEKLFVAVSVLNWAYLNYKDKKALQYYLEEVKKHLRGEVTLYWQNGEVKIRRGAK